MDWCGCRAADSAEQGHDIPIWLVGIGCKHLLSKRFTFHVKTKDIKFLSLKLTLKVKSSIFLHFQLLRDTYIFYGIDAGSTP